MQPSFFKGIYLFVYLFKIKIQKSSAGLFLKQRKRTGHVLSTYVVNGGKQQTQEKANLGAEQDNVLHWEAVQWSSQQTVGCKVRGSLWIKVLPKREILII